MPQRPLLRRMGDSTFAKLGTLAVLLMLLLIPVSRVTALIHERSMRQQTVHAEIAGVWGAAQTLLGPVVTLPYTTIEEHTTLHPTGQDGTPAVVQTTREIQRRIHVLPKDLSWSGELVPEVRYRGLFEVVVYEARIRGKGVWVRPSASDLDGTLIGPLGGTVDWRRPTLSLGVSDVRGLQRSITLSWGDDERDFLPGTAHIAALGNGIHAPLPSLDAVPPGTEIPFRFDIVLRGSGFLRVMPGGENTTVALRSSWPNPGFSGAFLPTARSIDESGFSASWQVPFFGRSFGQAWIDDLVDCTTQSQSAFGVDLVIPADAYQQAERSVKYAILFVALTFGTFFLLELLSPIRLHAVQYLLIGFALILFYVLLLALAEHLGLGLAYFVASIVTTGLISAYGRSILGNRRWALCLALCLGGLYGYLFVLLRLEDYALLLGALGLFAALATTMRLTRNLDWHRLEFRAAEASSTGQAAS